MLNKIPGKENMFNVFFHMTHTQKQEGWHLGLVDPYRRTRISVVVNGPPEISGDVHFFLDFMIHLGMQQKLQESSSGCEHKT